MRVIKLGLISIVVFAVVLTIISLFFPSHIRISKAIDINADREAILSQINTPSNWKNWYPGADTLAPLIENGHQVGIITGPEQAISITESNDSTVKAANKGPQYARGETGWNLYDGNRPHTITVQWYMDFHLHWYPWEKFSSLLLEKRYGPLMEKGLANLKSLFVQ